MRLRTLGALVTILCLLGIAGVRSDAAPKPGGTMKFALLRDPTGWDPHINQGATTYTFKANIYEGLLRYSQKGTLEPGLAVRWENSGPHHLRAAPPRSVKFHSGNPFTAEDVKCSIERIMAPATNATRAKEFSVVESVTVVDPSTVKITLKKPDAPFLELLASGEAMIVDRKWAQPAGATSSRRPAAPGRSSRARSRRGSVTPW